MSLHKVQFISQKTSLFDLKKYPDRTKYRQREVKIKIIISRKQQSAEAGAVCVPEGAGPTLRVLCQGEHFG